MGNQHDRLTRYGIVGLAGIAVLGWVREPEKHLFPGSSLSATFPARPSEPRKTFYPSAAAGLEHTDELPGDDPRPVHAGDTSRPTNSRVNSTPTVIERMRPNPVQRDERTSVVVKTPEHSPADTGRHEGPQTAQDDVVTRSREPRKEPSEDRQVQVSERPQDDRAPLPRTDRTDDTRAQTQPVVGKKQRSTARSAAIIVGTAAAGAAIGAAAGGGKGAAIGAISGTASGYVFDRMTRHIAGAPRVTDQPPNSGFDADPEGDYKRYDRPSLARRFGTPSFNGR